MVWDDGVGGWYKAESYLHPKSARKAWSEDETASSLPTERCDVWC